MVGFTEWWRYSKALIQMLINLSQLLIHHSLCSSIVSIVPLRITLLILNQVISLFCPCFSFTSAAHHSYILHSYIFHPDWLSGCDQTALLVYKHEKIFYASNNREIIVFFMCENMEYKKTDLEDANQRCVKSFSISPRATCIHSWF